MKTVNTPFRWLLSLGLLFLISLSACEDKVEFTRTYTVFEAVYTSPAEIRASFQVTSPEVLREPGKIYLWGNYLFINEPGQGIHVIDNSDKTNPVNLKFIQLPGSYDLSVKGGYLYADSYMDLVVLDIQDINNIRITSRSENIFASVFNNGFYDPERGIVTGWVEKETIEVSSKDVHGAFPPYFLHGWGMFATRDFALMSAQASPAQSASGIGGSMARFTIVGNSLYTIDYSKLYVFNIQQPENPIQEDAQHVGWGIETLFPSGGNLFIGAQDGMYIYSLANPMAPQRLSQYAHVMSCDPVVVHDTLAYVTLRGGTECRGFTNQLDIINIKDPTAPQLLVSHPMQSPYGLGYDKGLLFICEGQHGLKVFDVSDIWDMPNRLLEHYKGGDAYDVIPFRDVLILIGRDGLFQFDYSNPSEIKLLSQLQIERKNGGI
jgi:hypothetical protein